MSLTYDARMNNLRDYWNKSSSTIPDEKTPSAYAIEKEKLFPRKAVVCDLGGGGGVDALFFASQGHTIKLLDISDLALDKAKRAAIEFGLSKELEIYQANLNDTDIPLENESCDIVYSRLALHYFETTILARLLAEIYRVLRPGGQAYLTLKSPQAKAEMEYLKSTAVAKEDAVFSQEGHIKTRFSTTQLADMLQAAIPKGEYVLS